MEQIYLIRESMIVFYKKYEKVFLTLFRFIIAFFIFSRINHTLGYAEEFSSTMIVVVLSILSIIIPIQWFLLLIALIIGGHLFFASMEAAILILCILLIIYLMYVRLFPKQSLLLLAVPICFYLKIPYVVPLFAGLFMGIFTIIPITIGTAIWYFSFQIPNILEVKITDDLMVIPETVNKMIILIIQALTTDKMLVVSIIIFSAVIAVVYFISKLAIDYSWYIALGIGASINIIGFMIGMLTMNLEMSLIGLVLSSLISMLLVMLAQFFYRVVDYSRAEKVQFEDDENFYYVKVVPKIIIEKPKREIKRITRQEE